MARTRHLLVERQVEQVLGAEEAVLRHLPEPLRYSRGGSGSSTSVSHRTAAGLPEGADEVLALGHVHAGLATDGGVDLAEQRGRRRSRAARHGGTRRRRSRRCR
jgi:hypothetical protein